MWKQSNQVTIWFYFSVKPVSISIIYPYGDENAKPESPSTSPRVIPIAATAALSVLPEGQKASPDIRVFQFF
jgi:hypothetical protein